MRALVTRGHFRSRDKNGGHYIRFTISENTMLHANLFPFLSFWGDRGHRG